MEERNVFNTLFGNNEQSGRANRAVGSKFVRFQVFVSFESQWVLLNGAASVLDSISKIKLHKGRRKMKTIYVIGIMALAMAGIFTASAMAGPSHMGGFAEPGPHGDWMLLVDKDTTDLNNMTLKEIDDLRQQKASELMNMTLAEIEDLKEQKMAEFQNMTREGMNQSGMPCMDQGKPGMGPGMGMGGNNQGMPCMDQGKPGMGPEMGMGGNDQGMPRMDMAGPYGNDFGGHFGDWMLLVDNATMENFKNMTREEIQTLKDEKTEELQNMTPFQIQELRKQKMEELKDLPDGDMQCMRQNRDGWNADGGRGGFR